LKRRRRIKKIKNWRSALQEAGRPGLAQHPIEHHCNQKEIRLSLISGYINSRSGDKGRSHLNINIVRPSCSKNSSRVQRVITHKK
jgi:hypothetical protein